MYGFGGQGWEVLEVEFNFDGFVAAFRSCEIAFLFEAADAGYDVVGEAANGFVVGGYGVVEAATLGGDAVFGAFELHLEVAEALRCGEFWVTLDDDVKAAAEGAC